MARKSTEKKEEVVAKVATKPKDDNTGYQLRKVGKALTAILGLLKIIAGPDLVKKIESGLSGFGWRGGFFR